MRLLLLLALLFPALAAAEPPSRPRPGIVRVRFDTELGPVTIALEARRAPETTRNFLSYVDDRRFDGMVFYRVARRKSDPRFGFIQGGIRTDAARILPPFAHEPTTKTGIRHLDGTISMARRQDPTSAGGNFFITVGSVPAFDASPGNLGYAAFGRVVEGMATVRRILARPTSAGMRGQALVRPVRIARAVRLDGAARPTGRVKPWLTRPKPKPR